MSAAGDWRLPNINELFSLIVPRHDNGWGLPSGHPFVDVSSQYWYSTTDADDTIGAFGVKCMNGHVSQSGTVY